MRTAEFLPRHRAVLAADLFGPGYEALADAILRHYDETSRAPTPGELSERIRLNVGAHSPYAAEAAVGYWRRAEAEAIPDPNFVGAQVRDFAAASSIERVLSMRVGYGDDYDRLIRDLRDAAALREREADLVHYASGIEDRMGVAHAKVRPIATGLPTLDTALHGGVGVGEMLLLLGLAKRGKSHGLVHFSAAAAEAGKKVLFVGLEMRISQILQRFDQRIGRQRSHDLKREDSGGILARVGDRIRLICESPRRLSANGLRARLDRLPPDEKPDLIAVDYGALMKGGGGEFNPDQTRFMLEQIYLDLRAIAGEYQVAMWSAAQSNRKGTETEKNVTWRGEEKPVEPLTGEHMGECYAAVQHADGCISLNASNTEALEGRMRLYTSEVRDGQSRVTVPVKFDWSRSILWED